MAIDPSSDLARATWVTRMGRDAGHDSLRIRRVRLQVVEGPDRGKSLDLGAEPVTLGAREENDLVLLDEHVSGLHCELRVDERGYRLRDLGSKNGTHVSGHRIVEIFLVAGGSFSLGHTTVRLEPQVDSVELLLPGGDRFGPLVGKSLKMRELYARLARLATSDVTVLVVGEAGAGKALTARALHELSPRRMGPLVVVELAALAPTQVEAELFGGERGALGPGRPRSAGAFERARGGVVVLDEVAELPVALQPRLLRLLEQRELRRVGGTEAIPVDVRLVATSQRSLAELVNGGTFRDDLYYRLAVSRLFVPSLRDRREDIPLLVEHLAARVGRPTGDKLAPSALEALLRHDWPGNVRELAQVVERALMTDEPLLPGGSLVGTTPAEPRPTSEVFSIAVDGTAPYHQAKAQLVDEFERRYVSALLERHQGNVSAAARAAGLDRMTLHRLVERRGL